MTMLNISNQYSLQEIKLINEYDWEGIWFEQFEEASYFIFRTKLYQVIFWVGKNLFNTVIDIFIYLLLLY